MTSIHQIPLNSCAVVSPLSVSLQACRRRCARLTWLAVCSADSPYGVYRIPGNIPALPARAQEPAAPLGSSRRNGDIPLRSFNHIVPMDQVRATDASLQLELSAGLPGRCRTRYIASSVR